MLRFKTYLSEGLSPEEMAARVAAGWRGDRKPGTLSYAERSMFPAQSEGPSDAVGLITGDGRPRSQLRDQLRRWRPPPDARDSSNPINLGRNIAAGILNPGPVSSPVMPALGRENRTPATFSRPQAQIGIGALGARAVNRDAARERLASIQQTRGANILDTVVSGVGREMLRQDLRAGRKGASVRGMNIIGNISNAFLPTQQLTQGVGAAAGRLGRIAQRIANLRRPMGIGVNNPQTAQDEAQRQEVLQGAAQNQLATLRQNPDYQLYSARRQATQRAALGRNLDSAAETPEQIRQRMMGSTSPLSAQTRSRVQTASVLSGAQQIS